MIPSICPSERLNAKNEAVNNITIFGQIIGMSKCLNFYLGLPSFSPPNFVCESLAEAATHFFENENDNEEALLESAKWVSKKLNRPIDKEEIVFTNGSCQALFLIQSFLLRKGDEVISFSPCFQFYVNGTNYFSGVELKEIRINFEKKNGIIVAHADVDQLISQINENTRIIFLNSPQNPVGFSLVRSELIKISQAIQKYPRVIILADNVYEDLIFDSTQRLEQCSAIPGLENRTISTWSMGKLFHCTGWRYGVIHAPIELASQLRRFQRATIGPPNIMMQIAWMNSIKKMSNPYEGCSSYNEWVQQTAQQKYDKLFNIIQKTKLVPCISTGGYYVLASIENIVTSIPKKYFYKDKNAEGYLSSYEDYFKLERAPDYRLDLGCCLWLYEVYNVGICCTIHEKQLFLRITIFKSDEDIEALGKILMLIQQQKNKQKFFLYTKIEYTKQSIQMVKLYYNFVDEPIKQNKM